MMLELMSDLLTPSLTFLEVCVGHPRFDWRQDSGQPPLDLTREFATPVTGPAYEYAEFQYALQTTTRTLLRDRTLQANPHWQLGATALTDERDLIVSYASGAVGGIIMQETENMSKVWFITGAGRGMGVDIAKAALGAGHKVVATGRNTDKVTQAVGKSADLLVVRLDVTKPTDAESAVEASVNEFGPHRCTGQQCRKLLCRLLRGAVAGADGASALDQSYRPYECHPRGPAGHAQAAFGADNHDLINCGPDRF
jgi:hypothetical protein